MDCGGAVTARVEDEITQVAPATSACVSRDVIRTVVHSDFAKSNSDHLPGASSSIARPRFFSDRPEQLFFNDFLGFQCFFYGSSMIF